MLNFIKRYSQLGILLPLWLILGGIHPLLGYCIVLITLLFWFFRGKYHFIFLALIFIMVLSDSSSSRLNFQANLRIPILLFLVIATLKYYYQGRYGIKKIFLYVVPFFFIAICSILFSPAPTMAIAKTISYIFLLFIVFHLLPHLIRESNGELLIDISYAIALIIIIPLCLAPILPELVTMKVPTFNISNGMHMINERYTGFFANPNGLGLFAALVTPFLVVIANIVEEKRKFFIILGLAIIVSIIATESRSALGTVGIFYGLYFVHTFLLNKKYAWRKKIGRWGKRIFWFFIMPVTIILLSTVGLSTIIEVLGLSQRFRLHTLFSGAGRMVAWNEAWIEIKNNLWFGKGFHYDIFYFRLRMEELKKLGHLGGAHNSFISLLMNVGIIGVTFFLIFLVKLFKSINGYARKFIFPYIVFIILSTNLESWLAASLNYVTIFFFLTLVLLLHFQEFEQLRKRYNYP